MKIRLTIVAATAGAALGCASLLTACGSDDGTKTTAPTVIQADEPGHCQPNGKYPASPTVDLLTGLLRKGLDPNVPSAEKVSLVQGSSGDPDLFTRVGVALNQAGFSSQITAVTDYCNGTANADATLTFYGQTNQSQVPLVAEDGVWKLDKGWACGLAKSLQQSSPICE
ncbi:hypothetical protein ACQPZ2_23960 [Nocardia pseudovaccinii]|uniref:hypothetical protein n=1 Tax=Nocardia pseudovaccinii TaxID=189540 RepID=UPI003D8E4645